MRAFTVFMAAALLTVPVLARDKNRDLTIPAGEPALHLRSNATAVIDFVGGTQAAVVGKAKSLLEARYAPGADQIAALPHAIFVLADGTTVMKAIMYQWTSPVDLQIGLPYSDQWQVRAVYVGGIKDHTKMDTIAPLFISGRDFASGIEMAADIDVAEPRVKGTETECFRTAGSGCGVGQDGETLYPHLCYNCWWKFCGEPYMVCG